jgi:hypothetical protein
MELSAFEEMLAEWRRRDRLRLDPCAGPWDGLSSGFRAVFSRDEPPDGRAEWGELTWG